MILQFIEFTLWLVILIAGAFVAYCRGRSDQQQHCCKCGQDTACKPPQRV